MAARDNLFANPRDVRFWLKGGAWVRALTFWWVPAFLGLTIAVVGLLRLLRGGVAWSWRGLGQHPTHDRIDNK